ncbi:MAG: hypothetical protein M1352_02900 [Patescibacteria group bacterium]|nr:hypothetical protein [Patescibacteria group bacterium]
MNRELSLRSVVLGALLLISVPLVLVRFNFFERTAVYEGQVTETADGNPVDLATIKSGSSTTYTDEKGQFRLTLDKAAPVLSLVPTSDYEVPSGSFLCREKSKSFLNSLYICNSVLVPEPFAMASRVLSTFVGGGLQTGDEVKARKEKLWSYLASYSQKVWGSEENFVGFMSLNEFTKARLKEEPTGYSVDRNQKIMENYTYLGKVSVPGPVAEVISSVTDGKGLKTSVVYHFVEESRVWKLLFDETPQSIFDYNNSHSYAFSLKD